MSVRFASIAASLALSLCLSAEAQAQSFPQPFPTKPLRIIVPYAPGGLIDSMGRQLAQHLAEPLGQPLVVENRPGSAGAVGIDAVRQAPADGHTLLVVDTGILITPIIQPRAGFDLRRDMQVVSIVADTPLVLTLGSAVPAKELKDLIALAKASPGKLNYSSAGIGTTPHMSGEMLKSQAGVDIVHVPYKGGSAAIADVLSGQIQMTFLASTIVAQYLKDGRMRAIASTGTRRSRLLADVPTMAESGFPNFDVTVWVGLFGPKAVPRDILGRLNDAVKASLQKPEFRASLARSDVEVLGLALEESERMIEREERKWTAVVRANNVKPD